jgi:hypothetical protein
VIITGVTGELRIGGRVAARLYKWRLDAKSTSDAWHLDSQVQDVVEAWRMYKAGWQVRLTVGLKVWRGRVDTIEWREGRIEITGNTAIDRG